MRLLLSLLCVVALSACSTAGVVLDANKQVVIVPLAEDQVAAVQTGVRNALRDPDSAQFGDMKAAQLKDGRLQVCGMVNSKNGFGGYTGPGPFEGFLSGGVFTVEAMDTPYAINMCTSFGVAV